MRIQWSEYARNQIMNVFEYIAEDRPDAAEGVLHGFRAAPGRRFNQPVRDWYAASGRILWHSLRFLADPWCELHLLRMNPSDGVPRPNPALASRYHLIHGAP